MSAPLFTLDQLRKMLPMAIALGFRDDVKWLQEQIRQQEQED